MIRDAEPTDVNGAPDRASQAFLGPDGAKVLGSRFEQ
jgi:hypothetical protein